MRSLKKDPHFTQREKNFMFRATYLSSSIYDMSLNDAKFLKRYRITKKAFSAMVDRLKKKMNDAGGMYIEFNEDQ
jgi:hypothetical protein